MADGLCCSMYWLGLHNKNSTFHARTETIWKGWKALDLKRQHHSTSLSHDRSWCGKVGDIFWIYSEIPAGCRPLTPSFPYLLLRHKIGLDFISGKVLILKQAHHISSAECLFFFTDMVPRRNCYLTKVVNLSTPSMQIWPKKFNIDRMITAAYDPPNKWTWWEVAVINY